MLIETLDEQFGDMDKRQRSLIDNVPHAKLFWTPVSTADTMLTLSVGGGVLRSAAMVEQAFLGITRRLWDDPFEWTLPEKLSTKEAIIEYLDEVAETRHGGLAFITSDADLTRQLPAPEKLRSILQVLIKAIGRAENYFGRAEAIAKMISLEQSPKQAVSLR
jgi:hypothetical protein